MPIGKKFGAMQRNGIGPLIISHRYKTQNTISPGIFSAGDFLFLEVRNRSNSKSIARFFGRFGREKSHRKE